MSEEEITVRPSVLWLRAGCDDDSTSSVVTAAGLLLSIQTSPKLLSRALGEDSGALILDEAALDDDGLRTIAGELRKQPAWSDLPVLLRRCDSTPSPLAALAQGELGNVTLLEKPCAPATLVSAIQTALRARRRQFLFRDHLAEQARIAKALDESGRRQDRFLANLAHELRNPLAPIRNAIHILRLANRDDTRTVPTHEMMERQVGHLVHIVDDLLAVARVVGGKVSVHRESRPIADILSDAVERVRPFLKGRGVGLSLEARDRDLVVDGDAPRLSDVFAAVLRQAAAVSPKGSEVRLVSGLDGDTAEVRVRDGGPSLPAEQLPHVFDLFPPFDPASPPPERDGISLAMARSLVHLHHGSVQARSDGSCTEYIVRLPLTDPTIQEVVPRAAAATCVRKVLVVDDDRSAADRFGLALESAGARVRVAYDGPSALEAYGSLEPTVAVVALGLPGMDGYELLRRLRRQPHADDLIIIGLSSWRQMGDDADAVLGTFDAHLLKPAEVSDLERLLTGMRKPALKKAW